MDGYSVKLREEWTVKVEELDVNILSQVKEEPLDDNLVDQKVPSQKLLRLYPTVGFCRNWSDFDSW